MPTTSSSTTGLLTTSSTAQGTSTTILTKTTYATSSTLIVSTSPSTSTTSNVGTTPAPTSSSVVSTTSTSLGLVSSTIVSSTSQSTSQGTSSTTNKASSQQVTSTSPVTTYSTTFQKTSSSQGSTTSTSAQNTQTGIPTSSSDGNIATTTPTPSSLVVATVSFSTVTTLATALCNAPQMSGKLAATYGAKNVSILSVSIGPNTTDCPQFVCPCSSHRRNLLQANLPVIYGYQVVPTVTPTVQQLQNAVQVVFPQANVSQLTVNIIATVPYTPSNAVYQSISTWVASVAAQSATAADATPIIATGMVAGFAVFIGFLYVLYEMLGNAISSHSSQQQAIIPVQIKKAS